MFASIKVDKEYSKNQIFDIGLNDKKFDGRGYKYIKLREQFLKKGIQISLKTKFTHINPFLCGLCFFNFLKKS